MRTQAQKWMHAAFAVVIAAILITGIRPAAAKTATTSTTKVAEPSGTPDFEWREVLAAGKTVTIKGVNGSIEAELASGKEVEVLATKHATHSDPDEVRIEVARSAEGVTICAVYPSAKDGENACESGSDWSSHTHNNDVQVDFKVRVPAGVALVARNVNGGVAGRGLKGPVDLETVNGSVKLETTDYGMASTVNGGIVAVLGRSTWPRPLEFKTVNGTIDITLPGKVSTRVSSKTMNGRFETDFPMTVKGHVSSREMEGTIGGGDSELECESVNGSIRLHAAK